MFIFFISHFRRRLSSYLVNFPTTYLHLSCFRYSFVVSCSLRIVSQIFLYSFRLNLCIPLLVLLASCCRFFHITIIRPVIFPPTKFIGTMTCNIFLWFLQSDAPSATDKYGRRCGSENMEDGNGWTTKDRKTETEVERCYTKWRRNE